MNASRLSFAPTEGNLNRMSQFGGSQFFGNNGSQQELEMANLAGLPSDDALLAEIRDILRTADLMTVTKKGVKQELERRFGVPLDARRAYINSGMFLSLSANIASLE
jgi:chitin synthase